MRPEDSLVWLAWERQADGSFRVLETRSSGGGDVERVPRRFAGLEELVDAYGESLGELVAEVLESGSTRGRYRP